MTRLTPGSSSRPWFTSARLVWLILVAGASLLLGAACGTGGAPEAHDADGNGGAGATVAIDPPVAPPPLRLTDQRGQPFDLSSLRGSTVALYWGYTSCPDVCPTTTASLRATKLALPDAEREGFRVVMVTVDPERDTPEVMGRFLGLFDSSFVGLSGKPEEVRAALAAWGIRTERQDRPDGNYTVSHPGEIMLIAPDGRWTASTQFDVGTKTLVRAVSDVMHGVRAAPTPAVVRTTSAAPAERDGRAPEGWLVSRNDGSVVRLDEAGRETTLLGPWSARTPLDPVNPGVVLTAPAVAFDPVTRRLWYSDTHWSIRSLHVDTGEAGPTLQGFADTGVPGCGVASSGRALTIDAARRLIYVPMLTGQVMAYDLDSLEVRGHIAMATFGDLMLGQYRPVVSDAGRTLWVGAADGRFREFDTDTQQFTSREVPAATGTVASVDTGRGRLLLAQGGRLRAIDLATLRPTESGVTLPADTAWFAPMDER